MHAALVTVTIEPSAADAAQSALQTEIIPMVKASPGFIAGYWLEAHGGKAFAFVVYDTEEHARQTAPPKGASPTPGVTVEAVEFRPVAGHG